MMKTPVILLMLVFVGTMPLKAAAAFFIDDLVVNYANFSYVSSVAVGFKYVYFGTTGGILRYQFDEKRWAQPLGFATALDEPIIHEINASFDDESIWIRTDQGIYEYNRTFEEWQPTDDMPPADPRTRHLSPRTNFFAPWGYNYMTDGFLVDDRGRRFPVTDILDDGWSNLWLAIWGLGPAGADYTSRRIELLPYGILQEDVSVLKMIDGSLWMSGQSDSSLRTGVSIFDWTENRFDYIETYPSLIRRADDINDIEAGIGDVFLATDDGVLVVDMETLKVRDQLRRSSGLPGNQTSSVCILDSALWIGGADGLSRINMYSDSAFQSVRVFLPGLHIRCLEVVDDDLWIGTYMGAYRYNSKNEKIGRLTASEITQIGGVYDIKAADDQVWLATETELAAIDLNTAEIERFPEVFNYGGAYAVDVRDTLIAVATERGLLLLDKNDRHFPRLYTREDGLISNNVKDVLIEGEYIWVGTDRGLSRFWHKNPRL